MENQNNLVPTDNREDVDYSMPESSIIIDALSEEEKRQYPDFTA